MPRKSLISEKSPVGQSETEILRAQVAELKAMVEQMALANSQKPKPEPKQKVFKEIQPNEYIKVMSLVNNKLNLSTNRIPGKGDTYGFEKFGDVKQIFYQELLKINENHKNFLEAGYYYILDERVVRAIGKEEQYQHILSKDQIETVLSNAPTAITLFEGTNPKQQKVIIDFFIEKMVANMPVDYNLIASINRIALANGIITKDLRAIAKEI